MLLIEAMVIVDADYEYFVDKMEIWGRGPDLEEPEYTIHDMDWNEWVARVSIEKKLSSTFLFSVNEKN